MRRNTYRIALGGLMSAAALAILFLGSILPFATFAAPALASVCVLYFCMEYGRATAVLVYAAVGIPSLLIAPDKEQALIFICLLGYYPILKGLLERLRPKALVILLKILLCDSTMLGLYFVLTRVLVIESVREEFSQYTLPIVIGLTVLGTATFLVLDAALTRLAIYYEVKLRAKLGKGR